jgi:hypothetical protein
LLIADLRGLLTALPGNVNQQSAISNQQSALSGFAYV